MKSRLYTAAIDWSKTHSFPGFEGIPLYSVIDFIRNELRKENIIIRSNAMAFSFFMALFPSLIVLIALIPFLPIKDFVSTLKDSVLRLLPEQAALYVIDIIDSLTSITDAGALSFGLFLTFFFASNGMLSMLRGFEKNYRITYRDRSNWRRRLVAIQLTFILGGIFLASIAVIVLGRVLLDSFFEITNLDFARYLLFEFLRWVSVITLFYAGISATYRFGPAMKERIKYFSPGATLATVLSILTSIGFSYYVNRFGQFNELYGSLGAIIVLMLWMQINSLIILIGYELNASIRVNKDLIQLEIDTENQDPNVPSDKS